MSNLLKNKYCDLNEFLAQLLKASELRFLSDITCLYDRRDLENIDIFFSMVCKKYASFDLDYQEQDFSFSKKIFSEVMLNISQFDSVLKQHYLAGIVVCYLVTKSNYSRIIDMIGLIKRLSEDELSTHFLFYNTLNKKIYQKQICVSLNSFSSVFNMFDGIEIFIPIFYYIKSMGFDSNDNSIDIDSIFAALSSNKLINEGYRFFCPHYQYLISDTISLKGITCAPSKTGIELFLYAFGNNNNDLSSFFTRKLKPKIKGRLSTISYIFPV